MRIFTRIGVLFAPVFAAFCLMAAPASAQTIDFDFGLRTGPSRYYSSPEIGSREWVERRMIFNSSSPITRVILPSAAEFGKAEDEWLGGKLNVGLPTMTADNGAQRWMVRVGRYNANVNVRILSSTENYSERIVRMSVRVDTFGPGIRVRGTSNTVTVYAIQRRGHAGYWSFYSEDTYRGYRF